MAFLHAMGGVFGLILMGMVGYVLAGKGWFGPETRILLPRLITYVALPPYLMSTIMRAFRRDGLLDFIQGALLPLAAVASAACTLTDPTLTLQSYRVDAQKERIAMYWQDRHGKAWGSLRSLLAGIDGDGRVQMAMNGGIYAKNYAPLVPTRWCRSCWSPA